MDKGMLAELFYREIAKLSAPSDMPDGAKVEAMYRLLNVFFVEATRSERLQFTTLFSRIAYVCHQHQMERSLPFYIHNFRRRGMMAMNGHGAQAEDVALGTQVMVHSVAAVLGVPPPPPLDEVLRQQWPAAMRQSEVQGYKAKVRVLVLADDEAASQLIVRDEAQPEKALRVQYNIPDRNEHFMPGIRAMRAAFAFPLLMNLLDVEVDSEGVYRPLAWVIEPDYLIDVSAVAECFQPEGPNPWAYLLKKFMPFESTTALMLGNIANFFLDELMSDPEADFRSLTQRIFQLNPLAFCLFDDKQVREMMQAAQKHFVNLKMMVKRGFREQGIQPEDCFLEPSFYAETYGLQGRLDLFYRQGDRSAIVELKSGKPFMPNAYGISHSHFTQTLLYDLLVKAAFGKEVAPTNYILYSGQDQDPLRFAPVVKSQQYEALQLRNQLLAIEQSLANLGGSGGEDLLVQGQRLFGRLCEANFPQLKGFAKENITLFERTYCGMSEVERRYFTAFAGFIAREQRLAKAGVQNAESTNGQAALWLNAFEEKQADFNMLAHLAISDNQAGNAEPLITFDRTSLTHPLANFRIGDIVVLYPGSDRARSVLANQVIKCTIVDLTPERVQVRLRSRQFNPRIFEQTDHWHIERDLLDSSFTGMYRSLFEFAGTTPERRAVLLGQVPPRQGEWATPLVPAGMTAEQQALLHKALSARDYFLLWGPPGTGKTSVMLHHIVANLLAHTQENLLLLAYTNRAVDEICESIAHISDEVASTCLRIGSRYATAARFQPWLLNAKLGHLHTRQELQALIASHRVVVATVSSISGKPELLKLKTFHRVVIDEASQILEPMLMGLLSHFERAILVGDHRQLPAVVVQDTEQSAVHDPALQALGLTNLRNSLFERLYLRCRQHGWEHAYGQLSHQGRMHQRIMAFANEHFYDASLHILPPGTMGHERQRQPLAYRLPEAGAALAAQLAQQRLLFFSTPSDAGSTTQKTNVHEARLIADLVAAYQALFAHNGRHLEPGTIGIITPYRAQIAQIRHELVLRGLDTDLLTIDTVERYQGGAREVILISLCTNSLSQLSSLSSLSTEGIDRKLNVAMTRAREHLVIVGNAKLLGQSAIYRELIAFCEGGE